MSNVNSLMSLDNRKELAGSVQRTLNSFWESRIIKYILDCEKENQMIDHENLNLIIKEYLNLERNLIFLCNDFGLQVNVDVIVKRGYLKNIPRRFKVIVKEDIENMIITHTTITSKLCESFNILSKDSIYIFNTFESIREAFNLTFKIDDYIQLKVNDKYEIVQITGVFYNRKNRKLYYNLRSLNDNVKFFSIEKNDLKKSSRIIPID